MKRHISIFAFLLSAFAAGGATAAVGQGVTAYGYWPPEPGSVYIEDENWVKPNGGTIWDWSPDPLVFSAPLPKGWKVRHWRVKETLLFNNGDPDTAGNKLDGSLGKADLVWGYSKDYGNNVFLAVKYDYIKYNLKYDLDGGSGTAKGTNGVSYADEYALAAAPSKTGYTFGGWKDGSGSVFEAGQPDVGGASFIELNDVHEDGRNVTMTAQWTTNAYTIAYELDGGSSTGGPVSAKYGEVFELPHPDKVGSQFKGWKVVEGLDPKTAKWGSTATSVSSSISDANTLCKGNGDSTFFLNVSAAKDGAVKLQAVWAADGYTVTFDNQGADSGRGGISSMTVEYKVKPRDLEENEIPSKTGFDFLGYFETTGGQTMHWSDEGVYFKKSWPYTEGKTLYAGWNAHHYSISYDGLDDATGYPTSAAYGETFALKNPERIGYKFAGWNVTDGLASKDAKWGELPDQVTSPINSSWTDIKPDERNPDKTVYIKNLNTNDNAQVTLTANWVEVKYKATFEIAGVRYPPTKEVEVTYNGALPKVTVVPEYISGEIFRGYFTEPNGQGEQFWDKDGNPCPEGRVWPFDGDRMLYEYKTGFDYYITYDANGGEGSVPQQSCNSSNDVTLASGNELHRSGFHLCGWDFNKDHSSEECAFQPSQIVSASDLKVKEDGDTATLFAIWQDKHVRIAIDATGGTAYTNGVKVTALTYVDGEEYGFLPTAEKPHYIFAGWFTQAEDGERILEDSIVDYETVKTLYAHWTPERYFVAFDGNCATNADAMAVQEFAWDEERALSKSLYGRTGYAFDGWATNAVTMKKAFDDCQVVSNLVGTADATQTLYAVWHTNSYTVVFNGNGATSGSMEPQDFFYDQPQALSDCGFTRGELWSFVGWTNSAAGGPLYTNQETVVNLTAEDGGTVTFEAVWASELGPLSEAMGCDNLKWESEKWEVRASEGYPMPPCVRQVGDEYYAVMYAHIVTNGVLTFKYKVTAEGNLIDVVIGQNPEGASVMKKTWSFPYQEGVEWQDAIVEIPALDWDSAYIRIHHRNSDRSGIAYIDQMTWTPEGAHPVPVDGEDNVTISSAAVSDGKFTLSFEFNEDFDYLLKTNADLLNGSWGVMDVEGKKTDNILIFEPQIIEGQPQLFYKVETIKKK